MMLGQFFRWWIILIDIFGSINIHERGNPVLNQPGSERRTQGFEHCPSVCFSKTASKTKKIDLPGQQ